MEMIGALFTTVVGGTATTAGGAAATGLTLLQGLGTVFGAVATIGAGQAAKAQAYAEAEEQDFAARDEYISGLETQAALKKELASTIGKQAVAFAAGGVDLGSVSVQTAKDQAIKDAEAELGMASNDALARSLARRRAAANARASGDAALTSSIFEAGTSVISSGIDIYKRG